jgi:DNA-binding response OmpR family regulator
MGVPPPIGASAASTRRALVVDADAAARAQVRLHLGLAGFEVTELGDGAAAIAFGRTAGFALIVLEATLPEVDGITVCRALRGHGPNLDTPMLMLSPKGSEADIVVGLESGADDYLSKPFGTRELMARVHALVRRHHRAEHPSQACDAIERQGVLVDPLKRTATANGQCVDLTRQEFDLLHLLLSRPGIVFSREALLAKVERGETYVTKRTVDALISRLRRKLEADPQDPKLILTAWGVGYKCVDAE